MSLFKMWEDALINKKLPKEWIKWDSFRSWSIKNNYKAEYGFVGKFNPKGCLEAIPNQEDPKDDGGEDVGQDRKI